VGGALLVGYAVATSVWAQAAEPVPGEKTSTPVQGTALTHHAVSDHAAADAQALLQRLQSLYPATRFGSVQPTPWAGVFEVQMGATLAYADATGRHFLFGHLYDMQSQTDLTAQRKDVLSRVDVATLPLADAMTEVRGSGKRQLIIFSDPDCPFCRRLEADLQGLTDVTIHTFLMPLASLHPQARAKAVAVWCAPDRLAAWKALMLRGVDPGRDAELNPELNPGANPGANLVANSGTKPDPSSQPPAAACDHPVDRNVALADKLGIHGTPTLVAGDGRLIQGAQSLEQVSAWLYRSATAASAPSSTKP
jgi:thiol:disulfide interchange protein DsbC